MRVVVCGSRILSQPGRVRVALDKFHGERPIDRLAAGDADGVDDAAITWARALQIPAWRYAAEWKRLGAIAGPARNERMLLAEKPDALIVFPGGIGTNDCAMRAAHKGIEIVRMYL
jgi:hypothetical protein